MTHGTEQCRFETLDWKVLKKTIQKQATLRITVGKRTGFGPLFEHFFDKFGNFLMLWLLGNLTQVATSRPCRARCI